jgi:hypothetical protein
LIQIRVGSREFAVFPILDFSRFSGEDFAERERELGAPSTNLHVGNKTTGKSIKTWSQVNCFERESTGTHSHFLPAIIINHRGFPVNVLIIQFNSVRRVILKP